MKLLCGSDDHMKVVVIAPLCKEPFEERRNSELPCVIYPRRTWARNMFCIWLCVLQFIHKNNGTGWTICPPGVLLYAQCTKAGRQSISVYNPFWVCLIDSIQNRLRYTRPDALNIASQVCPSQIRVVIKNEGWRKFGLQNEPCTEVEC